MPQKKLLDLTQTNMQHYSDQTENLILNKTVKGQK